MDSFTDTGHNGCLEQICLLTLSLDYARDRLQRLVRGACYASYATSLSDSSQTLAHSAASSASSLPSRSASSAQ